MDKDSTNHNKKIIGAVLSSIGFSLFYILLACMITYFQFVEDEKVPWIFFFVIILFFVIPVAAIIVNLVARIREIKGGEEDEASKY